ncbi:MAG: dual specificity protein phosphatase family protein [Pseudomonadota bacterium]
MASNAPSHPLFLIPDPAPGRLYVMPAPRAGALDDWIEDLRTVGVTNVVSLVSDEEVDALGLRDEVRVVDAADIDFTHCPVTDFQTPEADAARVFVSTVEKVADAMRAGHVVAVHCRAGIGRSGLLSACVLKALGADADAAIRRVTAARGHPSPENERQRAFVRAY